MDGAGKKGITTPQPVGTSASPAEASTHPSVASGNSCRRMLQCGGLWLPSEPWMPQLSFCNPQKWATGGFVFYLCPTSLWD
jgi:hypothetical protein